MSFIHNREYLNEGDTVSVQSSHQINVLLLDDINFSYYKTGRKFNYFGGFYKRFPVNVSVPNSGHWNVVLALPPGHRANIKYSINVIPA
ncbi:Domain of uncharacterised function (DUF1883) [Pragia fontium]|uniref:DUF1883 domain-containing protein n=1 Tax=Pragia fontium TaxID=82985 RepID=UPI000649F6B2|nr:DUF1883 domain-containing protein [Pragia fontium]AKJ41821.1 hypothetical protein QQ39_06760 [Pragia fontium]SUB82036.1 Domain of uncharacterised function (DUF1883) [Pragia fontium]